MIQFPRQPPADFFGAEGKGSDSLPLPLFLQLDEACNQFEAAWQTAARSEEAGPRIEDYVESGLKQGPQAPSKGPPSSHGDPGAHSGDPDATATADVREQWRQALVRELIPIDLVYRFRRGQKPTPEEYLNRFPSLDRDWLASAFAARAEQPFPGAMPGQPERDTVTGAPVVQHSLPGYPGTVPSLPLPIQFDDYELLEEVNRGGMGVVYKARQLSLNRLVALKMILENGPLTEETLRRFHREAQAAAALDHPNLVPIHASGQYNGRPFFTMAYVKGDNLRELVRHHGPLRPHQAVELLRAVAEAVAYAHQQGIIHRDLKPENVLIDSQGWPRVADFGLAFRIEEYVRGGRLTRTDQVLGTPAYMSPEQARNRHELIGPATDVYSLGGILYFLLTGQPPFQGENVTDVLCQVLTTPPTPPRQINPQAPAELEAICLRCLEKDPNRRYPSADALAAALRGSLRCLNQRVGLPPSAEALPAAGAVPRTDTPDDRGALAGGPVRPSGQSGGWRWGHRLWASVTVAGLVAGVWLASWWPATGPKPIPGPISPLGTPMAPPEKLRTDFGLAVAMVGKVPGADGLLRLRAGEEVKFQIKVAQTAYVGIWSVNADGTIFELFPNDWEPDHRFLTNEERLVPRRMALAEETGGIDWIWVQASTRPWSRDEGQRKGPFLLFQTDRERDLWAQRRRSIRLQPPGTLAEAVLKFRVEP